jgi:MFS transporter, FHS family, L-fucose permease
MKPILRRGVGSQVTLKKLPLIDKNMIVPFCLLATCFAVWGLAQDLTAPLVTAFKGIFTMSTFEASLVQFAYFGAYFALALPTAFLNQRFGYKVGVLTGLGLAAIGAFGFYPAAQSLTFGFFLIALFIMAAGLSVLETSANPFAIAMGPEGTATRRLNLAQSFNPVGTISGVALAAVLVLPMMNPATPEERAAMPRDALIAIQTDELNAIMVPYLGLSVLLVLIWIGIAVVKVPRSHEEVASDSHHMHFTATVRRLHHNHHWRYGVLAQFFNVGAQVCTWTYIVLYVAEVVPGGTAEQGAYYLLISLIIFLVARFAMTWLMGYIRATKLMAIMASIAILLCLYAAFVPGISGAWALVGVSACLSLMFPTIYGVALHGLGEDTKFAAAGLVMAIVGGALMPPIQGLMTDRFGAAPAFVVAAVGYLGVLVYAIYDLKSKSRYADAPEEEPKISMSGH